MNIGVLLMNKVSKKPVSKPSTKQGTKSKASKIKTTKVPVKSKRPKTKNPMIDTTHLRPLFGGGGGVFPESHKLNSTCTHKRKNLLLRIWENMNA